MSRLARPLALLFVLALVPLGFAQDQHLAKDKANLKKLETSYKASKAKLAKKPNDAALKKQCATTTTTYATAVMLTDTMPPKEKYSGALRLYREALKLDPKNQEALKNKNMIESIYKSMGRPIPK